MLWIALGIVFVAALSLAMQWNAANKLYQPLFDAGGTLIVWNPYGCFT